MHVRERFDDDHPEEACGVFGAYAPGMAAAYLTFDGLFALQHRGQESAGMAVSDGRQLWIDKDMGLVSNVFNDYKLATLQGWLAIGHTRYSTTGASTWRNAQPVYRDTGDGGFALGHNGNLTNTAALAAEAGMLPGVVASDSDLVAELLGRVMAATATSEEADRVRLAATRDGALAADGPNPLPLDLPAPVVPAGPARDERNLERALLEVLPQLEGAFSFVLCDVDHLIGVRDPNGFRPLCLGRLEEGGWVLASETPALDVVGAHFVRELDPGEMVVIDPAGCRSLRPFGPDRVEPKLCVFEFVYFARPDSRLYGKEVQGARQRMGELLAEQAPLPVDSVAVPREAMVMGVPDSGVPAAEGFARRSGIPYGQGLVKNRYIGRTFIAPDQHKRDLGVRRKLNPLRDTIAGKRLVVVDDSIVRGTTSKQIVRLLREAGAAEVHLRIISPPYRWPCFYGMDTGSRGELLAANLSVGEIQDFLGVDSLAYLQLDRLLEAIDAPGAGFCTACLTGDYPVDVPVALHKGVLETVQPVAGA
ncbi:MAG: amidophosphoribosyltransferase [Acidimicrobiales bacterium]